MVIYIIVLKIIWILILYYYQVGQVSDALNDFGMNALQIDDFYQTAYLPTAAIDQIGESTLSGGFNAYRSVMVGASGALYGVLVGFAMIFPNARLMLLFPPIPVKAKVLVPILILSDLFFGSLSEYRFLNELTANALRFVTWPRRNSKITAVIASGMQVLSGQQQTQASRCHTPLMNSDHNK